MFCVNVNILAVKSLRIAFGLRKEEEGGGEDGEEEDEATAAARAAWIKDWASLSALAGELVRPPRFALNRILTHDRAFCCIFMHVATTA